MSALIVLLSVVIAVVVGYHASQTETHNPWLWGIFTFLFWWVSILYALSRLFDNFKGD